MRSVLFAAALAVTLSSSSPLLAQATQAPVPAPAQQALPEARTIIDRHIELIGGRKALMGHSSTRAVGTVSMPAQGMNGTFEMLGAKPNKVLVRVTVPGIGEMLEGFDGTNGWSVLAIMGPSLSQGKELEQTRFFSDYFAELHDPARYDSIKTVEKATFDGRACYKISLVRKGGGEDFEFYDVATGLKAGVVGSRETQMGAIVATEMRGEYRKFGNLLQPTSIRQSAMGIEQVVTITTVEYDNVPSTAFEPPAAVKALIK